MRPTDFFDSTHGGGYGTNVEVEPSRAKKMVIISILISYEILGDTAIDDKLMYILNDHKQNYPFCRFIGWKDTISFVTTNQIQ